MDRRTAVTESTQPEAPDHPNWQQLVVDLVASGMTQSALAAHVGLTQGAISHLRTGKQKSLAYVEGKRLIDLHRERCPNVGITEMVASAAA
jgi:predicted transcriptional regulator